jgi:hypothetical protein
MAALHDIDCHVLTLPRFAPEWVEAMKRDLDGEPVNQHWLEGIDGDLGSARAAGFACGDADFVTSQDPDDRLTPGVYAALRQALLDNPGAPFAWAGEKMVAEDLGPHPSRPHVWPEGYHPLRHVTNGQHVHGVKLYRRELVMPLLDGLRRAGLCCEFFLDLALARPWSKPRAAWPVHVPIVGRLWRQHFRNGGNGSRQFTAADFDRMAQTLGFESMEALRTCTREAV